MKKPPGPTNFHNWERAAEGKRSKPIVKHTKKTPLDKLRRKGKKK